MTSNLGDVSGLVSRLVDKEVGPWPCEACGERSQYAEITHHINRVYCRNPSCEYRRLIDKRRHLIIENDGSTWAFDGEGNKWRVRAQ